MLLVIHCFGSGQVFLLSQLQLSVSVFCDLLFLIICALCLLIIDLTLCMQLYSLLLKCFCWKSCVVCAVMESIRQLSLRIPVLYVRVNTLKWSGWTKLCCVAYSYVSVAMSVRKFMIKVTMSEGVLVNKRRFLKCLFVRCEKCNAFVDSRM
jgi:hypothetical protein